jgi:hypothetical protein
MPFDQNFSSQPPYAGSGSLGPTPPNVTLPATQDYPVPPNVSNLPYNPPDLPEGFANEGETYFPTTSAVYGIPLQWKSSDLPSEGGGYAEAIKLVDKASSNTTSNPAAIGARGVQVIVQFFPTMSGAYSLTAAAMSCNVALYTYNPETSVTTEVTSWLGVTPGDDLNDMFVGNLEEVDLNGLPLSISVSSIVGGSVSVYVVPLS